MITSTRGRFGVAALAAVVVAGAGLLAAVPANAATGTALSSIGTQFIAGDWGNGIQFDGSGFDADSNVVVDLIVDGSTVESTSTRSLTDGSIKVGWTPSTVAPERSADVVSTVTATDVSGNTASLTLSILDAPGVVSNPDATISTADWADPNGGVALRASGFAPGETVTMNVVYNGVTYSETAVADASGTAAFGVYLMSGSSEPGTIDFTFTGAAHTETKTITVTGDPVGGSGDADLGGAATAPAGAPTLPVVSG